METVLVPRSVIKRMVASGAGYATCSGVVMVTTDAGSCAAHCFDHWVATLDEGSSDPFIEAVCESTLSTQSPVIRANIVDEANCIISQFATLRMASFEAREPAIAGFSGPVAVPIKFHHAQVASHKLLSRLADPNLGPVGAPFHAIGSVARGQYLCTVVQSWKGTMVRVRVYHA